MYQAPFSYSAPSQSTIAHVHSYSHIAPTSFSNQYLGNTSHTSAGFYQPVDSSKNVRGGNYARDNYGQVKPLAQEHSNPQIVKPFLRNDRPKTRFINTTNEVSELVHSLYAQIMDRELTNVLLHVCSGNEMKQHYVKWTPNVLGFARNANGYGLNNIFITKAPLDEMILTIGHEIGHIVTPSLLNKLNEEAKAFAFEFAWLHKIIETDAEGLARNLKLDLPAQNGLHDKSFAFVVSQIRSGKNPLDLFFELANGQLHVEDTIERVL